jgi:hypothetical protein
VGLLEIHHGVLAEHAPLFLVGAVNCHVPLGRLAARSLDVAQGLEQAVLGADGSVSLDESDRGELGALLLDAATDLFGGDVVCHVGVPLDFHLGGRGVKTLVRVHPCQSRHT